MAISLGYFLIVSQSMYTKTFAALDDTSRGPYALRRSLIEGHDFLAPKIMWTTQSNAIGLSRAHMAPSATHFCINIDTSNQKIIHQRKEIPHNILATNRKEDEEGLHFQLQWLNFSSPTSWKVFSHSCQKISPIPSKLGIIIHRVELPQALHYEGTARVD